MGTYYYLANNESKTLYELGKGSWYDLKEDLEYLKDPEILAQHLFDYVFNEPDGDDWPKYCAELAKTLCDFANGDIKNIRLINDTNDDLTIFHYLKFKYIGSRYDDFNSDHANKHLTQERAHMYKIEDMLKYTTQEYIDQLTKKI